MDRIGPARDSDEENPFLSLEFGGAANLRWCAWSVVGGTTSPPLDSFSDARSLVMVYLFSYCTLSL